MDDDIYIAQVLEDIDDVYRRGEYIKVKVINGKVYPWTGGGMEIYPDEFQFMVGNVEKILGL